MREFAIHTQGVEAGVFERAVMTEVKNPIGIVVMKTLVSVTGSNHDLEYMSRGGIILPKSASSIPQIDIVREEKEIAESLHAFGNLHTPWGESPHKADFTLLREFELLYILAVARSSQFLDLSSGDDGLKTGFYL
ncbi:MAG TPA: hypothetical protein VNI82_00425 [Candidatus Nitrosotenuis sp.]|nr:hypothetical protein [Candidatus Nitrosotenuis sp.]